MSILGDEPSNKSGFEREFFKGRGINAFFYETVSDLGDTEVECKEGNDILAYIVLLCENQPRALDQKEGFQVTQMSQRRPFGLSLNFSSQSRMNVK